MEIVLELILRLLVQVVLEVFGEVLWEGATRTLRSRTGRAVVGAIIGFVGGLVWGIWYTDLPEYPKTLWVSLALALAAFALAVGARGPDPARGPRGAWAEIATWPWDWPAHRLHALALLNVAIAAGVTVGYLGS